ncbi:tyrosine-type recombinase/integrase [Brevibacillus laterosporus]|uniref:tyrosine-type recombinase/integrase n=1 Tax=Brevibacillus laterosporus TaxID=1465 RepID=UPI001EEE37BD|nr:tyrosine-type recombinase/integrase [Brevibacillus laterosporus]MED2006083.1 tyrosine-type recombinase/integrase [Brevibacillus laterosporus]MED4762880.1 tyrosine-type recombinase/integrase [Brevibacillus laterosporus]
MERWKCFFVFFNAEGKSFYPESPYLWFRTFLKKHHLRYIRFHNLRLTSATILINQGVQAKIISERLGHPSISTTMNVYGHALQSADEEAANKFESIFQPKASGTTK